MKKHLHFSEKGDIINLVVERDDKNKKKIVGVDDAEGPPVPIPNTEVKLSSAEDSWLEAACENRKTPTFIYSSIAQSVERMTVNHDVTGSSPVGGANTRLIVLLWALFIYIQKFISSRMIINLSERKRYGVRKYDRQTI